ncbi:Abhydrolase-3 domain-containing protein [Fusarium keratoplasticum]|nr:Abhydrolase-3 domain-containing protein [Fusarium keratoplasticum]
MQLEEDYVNPLESSPRWRLSARAYILRAAAKTAFAIANRSAPYVTRVVWLDSTLGACNGPRKIKVEIWETPRDSVSDSPKKRPAIINFHGGGFVLGQGTDDARWAGTAMADLGATVFSINYRLAPTHPFPKAVEDCADSIVQICNRAGEFGVDRDRVILSGFSSGGALALASWVLLQDSERWDYQLNIPQPTGAGIVLFYPLLDWTLSRPQKRLSCPRPDLTLPKYITDLFDASYVYPPLTRAERNDARLSPGLMSDELLDRLPPVHLCLAEYDMLLAEGLRFGDRLRTRGKRVSIRVVAGEKHGWDKFSPKNPENISIEYGEATKAMLGWLELATSMAK